MPCYLAAPGCYRGARVPNSGEMYYTGLPQCPVESRKSSLVLQRIGPRQLRAEQHDDVRKVEEDEERDGRGDRSEGGVVARDVGGVGREADAQGGPRTVASTAPGHTSAVVTR